MCTLKARKFFPHIFNICILSKAIPIYHTVQEPNICIDYQASTESFTKQQPLAQTDSTLRQHWTKLKMREPTQSCSKKMQ